MSRGLIFHGKDSGNDVQKHRGGNRIEKTRGELYFGWEDIDHSGRVMRKFL